MIGDQVVDDFEGATAAGWQAVLIDRDQVRPRGVRAASTLVEAVEMLLR
ncbi:MAG: HAD hydrolase-like protein [Blastochloris sp.]|nr:HAD hydrolase-like protein [Blastochloris sp.]